MWVGTYNNGLHKVDINTLKSSLIDSEIYPELPKRVYALKSDANATIWAGGINGDLVLLDANGIKASLKIPIVKDIIQSKEGNILVANKMGVYRVDGDLNTYTLIKALEADSKNLTYSTINALAEMSNGNILVATNGAGLLIYDIKTENVQKLTMAEGMPSDVVQGLLMINDSHYWVSTTKGLAEIKVLTDEIIINTFNKSDGLAGNEFNYGSYARLKNGRFAFGSTEGVTIFDPSKIVIDKQKPSLVFTKFSVSNREIAPAQPPLDKHINEVDVIELKDDENSIEFQFAGVLHNASSKILYSYKLDGFNDEWSEPGIAKSAVYTNLNPGTYKFWVKAANNNGSFGAPRSKTIKISPPWYATWFAYIIYALLVMTLIYAIVHFTSVIIKKRNADEQIDFYNNITHEIKTPLAILISSLENTNGNDKTNEETKTRIKTTVARINALFEQLLNFHRVTSASSLERDVVAINLEDFFKKLIQDFAPLIEERNLNVIIENKWLGNDFYYDVDIMRKILLNIVSNAIKYSNNNGMVSIKYENDKNENLIIKIDDEGLGIPKDQQKFILKKYYRARNAINSQSSGTGLGLMMVKNLIDKTGGNISFTSEENVGTKFKVTLNNLIPEGEKQILKDHDAAQRLQNKVREHKKLQEFSDRKILIVEDNDTLRELMTNTLGEYFQVFEAVNGREGLEQASQVFPDIIITDLIMPELDGMQMVKKLKADINLNHIPVFMLTVLQNSTQKLESIESGIAEYIEKPVDINFLLAKIINALSWQQRLQKKYIQEADSDAAGVFKNKKDSKFLKKLEKTVVKNLENQSFSVHDLSEEFGMSRTSLYMKLKNLVDLSPQDFIIHTKLKLAKKLLIKGHLSIKEVAYTSGFSNPKYFSTSFKKFYGMTPSAFIDSLQKNK